VVERAGAIDHHDPHPGGGGSVPEERGINHRHPDWELPSPRRNVGADAVTPRLPP
jgi:hypothetical protein